MQFHMHISTPMTFMQTFSMACSTLPHATCYHHCNSLVFPIMRWFPLTSPWSSLLTGQPPSPKLYICLKTRPTLLRSTHMPEHILYWCHIGIGIICPHEGRVVTTGPPFSFYFLSCDLSCDHHVITYVTYCSVMCNVLSHLLWWIDLLLLVVGHWDSQG